MKLTDIEQLQKFLVRSAPLNTPETLFERAKRRFDPEQTPSFEQYGTLQFTVTKSKKPAAGVDIALTDKHNDPFEWSGTKRTTKEGRGLISVPLFRLKNTATLQLTLSQDKKELITVKHLKPSSSGKSKFVEGSYSLEIEWLTDNTESRGSQTEPRIRRFNIAVAGKGKDLIEPVAFVNRHGCFRLKEVYIEGKRPKDLDLPKKIRVISIGKDIKPGADNIDIILDFGESKILKQLWLNQVKGEKQIPALIIPVGHFLGKIDHLDESLRPLYEINGDKRK